MARYKLILAYDGTAFAGSQRQAKHRTVQGELEKALRGLGWPDRSVTLAGRTDTGVHASGQVAAFDLDWPHSLDKLRDALNANLPADIAAKVVQVAATEFHPRFSATSRCYRYRLFSEDVRDPLRERFAWRVRPAFDGNLLNEIAKVFLGQHDFSAFGSPPREKSSTTRTVMFSEWKRAEGEWQYEVRADAFLYRMVRRLVYVQIAVAQGRCSKQTVVKALEKPQTKNEIPAGLAPAHGLTLIEVTY
ncbi:MAG: tRNA pseudouridine(38-40) synthase TruA [Chloroflexi bacterium]|nr:tRNA pseudouridine(38-40) synthase TruA [Chloroflexota bacterium]